MSTMISVLLLPFLFLPILTVPVSVPVSEPQSTNLTTASRWSWSTGKSACLGGDEYACLDWTFGSDLMLKAAGKYRKNTHYVVGSYDRPENMGKCYKFYLTSSPAQFILQVVNEGSDVRRNQVDMQTGGGGVGLHNACTEDKRRPGSGRTESISIPMFDGTFQQWGERFGGWHTKEGCDNLPICPAEGCKSGENLRGLCARSWDWGARAAWNADITWIQRVKCPKELYEITGLRLLSDDTDFDPEGTKGGKVTSMMDCCKPSAGLQTNVLEETDPHWPSVRPCGRDGYTRLGRRGGA